LDLDAAQSLAARFGGVATNRFDDLLKDSSIDIIDVCTPPDQHLPMAKAAAQAGKHLLIEKPLARTLEGADGIIPDGSGQTNPAGLDYYDRVVDALLEAGVSPFVPLYHWDLPRALQDKGGWANRATVDAFIRYTDVVGSRLGDRVKQWMTHNEPWCVSILKTFT
jgi:hypothetical protein